MRILVFAFAMLSTICCTAKKMIMGIDAVILSADLIVVGEITRADPNAYYFRIDETLYVRDTAWHVTSTRVNVWEEWTCDWRDFDIVEGQRLLLLLRKGKHGFSPINASTGEIPLRNDSLILRNEEKVHVDYESHPYRLSFAEFRAGVLALRQCAHMDEEEVDDLGFFPGSAKWLCEETTIAGYLKREDFTGWLFRKTEKYHVGTSGVK